jgi:hypothetical protein
MGDHARRGVRRMLDEIGRGTVLVLGIVAAAAGGYFVGDGFEGQTTPSRFPVPVAESTIGSIVVPRLAESYAVPWRLIPPTTAHHGAPEAMRRGSRQMSPMPALMSRRDGASTLLAGGHYATLRELDR